MDRAAGTGATQGITSLGGDSGIGDARPGHRKCMSDTFAFVAGQGPQHGGSLPNEATFLDEEGDFGLDSEDCDDVVNAFMDMEDAKAEEGGKKGKHARKDSKSSLGSDDGKDDSKDDDPKRAKRIMANRQSAQRSRMRKMQYTSDLEKSVTRLHTEISNLNPQLIYLRTQHQDLSTRNRDLRSRITALLQETQYKDQMNNSLRDQVIRMKKVPPSQPGQPSQGGQQQQQQRSGQTGPPQMMGGNPQMMGGIQQMPMQPMNMGEQRGGLGPGSRYGNMMPHQQQRVPDMQQQQQSQMAYATAPMGTDSGAGIGGSALQWRAA